RARPAPPAPRTGRTGRPSRALPGRRGRRVPRCPHEAPRVRVHGRRVPDRRGGPSLEGPRRLPGGAPVRPASLPPREPARGPGRVPARPEARGALLAGGGERAGAGPLEGSHRG